MHVETFEIRDAVAGDATRVAAIYNVHVRGTTVTFELDDVSVADMCARIAQVRDAGLPWLVIAQQGVVQGYAYAGPWKSRAAYARTAETSIYLDPAIAGHGHGKRLYAALIERLRAAGIHVAIGGAALPNAASVALHEALGFRPVGVLEEVGHKFGRWIDVGYWQLQLEAP